MEDEINEETREKILELMRLLGSSTPEEALKIVINMEQELVTFATKRYGLPAKEAKEKFWEEVEVLEEKLIELEDHRAFLELLRIENRKLERIVSMRRASH